MNLVSGGGTRDEFGAHTGEEPWRLVNEDRSQGLGIVGLEALDHELHGRVVLMGDLVYHR